MDTDNASASARPVVSEPPAESAEHDEAALSPMESALAAEERGEGDVAPKVAADLDDPPPVVVKRRSAVLAILYLSVFIDMSGTSIVVPVIPYLAREFNSSPTELGLLYSGYALTQMIANVVGGRLSDRVGRRRVILVYLVGSAVGFFVQGLAETYTTYLLARLLTGLFAGSAPVVQAFVADITGRKERPKYLAMVGSVIGLAFLFGPGIGAGLAEFSLAAPMFVSSGVALFGFALALYFIPDVRVNAAPADADTASEIDSAAVAPVSAAAASAADVDAVVESGTGKGEAAPGSAADESEEAGPARNDDDDLLPYTKLIPAVICAGFCNIGSTTAFFTMFGILMADKFGYTTRELGFTLSGSAVVYITAQVLLFGYVSRRFGKHAAGMAGTLILAASIFLMPTPSSPALVFVFVFTHSIGFALSSPSIPSLLSRYSPSKTQGRVLGYGQAAEALSRVIMPPILGALYQSRQALPFIFCAIVALVSTLCLAVALVANRRIHAALDKQLAADDAATASRAVAVSWDNVNAPDDGPADVSDSAAGVFGGDVPAGGGDSDGDDDAAVPVLDAEDAAAPRRGSRSDSTATASAVAAALVASVPADLETRPLSTAEQAAAAAVARAGPVDAETAYHIEVGHFLVTLLRKRGYASLAQDTRTSKYALAGALSKTFPRGRRRARTSSAGSGEADEADGPSIVFSPDLFVSKPVDGEEDEQVEPLVCAVTF